MKYGLKVHGVWNAPWWNAEKDDGRTIVHSEDNFYNGLDEDQFKSILKEEIDVVDYKITPKNVKKEFGYTGNGLDIDKACMKRIIGYYKFRKELYEKICKQFLDGGAETMAKKLGVTEAIFRYDVPEECNSFDCKDPEYDSGQLEAWIEVSFYAGK